VKKDLFFNDNGTFKILQFTDIHYTEDNELDHRTTDLMRKLIREEKPDFIITTGDTVYGPDNAKNLEKALAPIIESGIPWSYTFGNHDAEWGQTKELLFSIIESLPNCVAYNADDSLSGMGNHYLEVKSKQGETKWVLFGIDTGMYNPNPKVGGYDYIKEDQIRWYKNAIGRIEQERNEFSALIFMHIALMEYHEVWEMETCYGEKLEGIGCPRINSGFYAAMQEAGHAKGVFVGHDHINDFMGDLYGITLGYGRATGYNTYGEKGYLKGARVIEIKEDDLENFRTHIRLEDGTVIKEQKKHEPERVRDDG
jgi:3',5'-cyclic AMP phosphodiesterase CpdA